MSAVSTLKPGQTLRLLAPFEPIPLFGVLAKQGFSHTAQRADTGDWEVLFKREAAAAPTDEAASQKSACSCGCCESSAAQKIELDVRGLEPPQPMVAILEALTSLPPGAELRALTNRRPVHLYPRLEERGFIAETEELENGSFITHIRRK
jgi:uncharacterized protein (DUF2249 family)